MEISDILKNATFLKKSEGCENAVNYLLDQLVTTDPFFQSSIISKITVYYKDCSLETKERVIRRVKDILENYQGLIFYKSDIASELSSIYAKDDDIQNAVNYVKYAMASVHTEDSSYFYKLSLLHKKSATLMLRWNLTERKKAIFYLHDLLSSYLFEIMWETLTASKSDDHENDLILTGFKSIDDKRKTSRVQQRIDELKLFYITPFPFNEKDSLKCFVTLAPNKAVNEYSDKFISLMLEDMPVLWRAEKQKFNFDNVGADIVDDQVNKFMLNLVE